MAFRVITVPHPRVVCLAGAVKKPKAPKYLIREVTKKLLEELNPSYVVTRTQNDKVVDMLVNLCDLVVPLDRPPTLDEFGAIMIAGIGEFSDYYKLIIPKYYGSPMIAGPRPRSKSRRVREFMDEINYANGDARVLIGRKLK